MKLPDQVLGQKLVDAGKISERELPALLDSAKKRGLNLFDIADQRGLASEEEICKWYAEYSGVEFVKIDPKKIEINILKTIPEHIAELYQAVIYGKNDDKWLLAMADPDDVQAVDFIQKQLGSRPIIHLATKQNIISVIELYSESSNNYYDLADIIEDDDQIEEEVSTDELTEDSPIAQTLNRLVSYAIKNGASDIHIEPREDFVQIRYRIDGVLQEANKLPKKIQSALTSRVKIVSSLKIDEHRIPQDGRFKIEHGGGLYALRVSTLPVSYGEKIVMRILDESGKSQSFPELGFWGTTKKSIEKAIAQPHGMVLVTGPTGSGKSTTLFGFLSKLNKPTVNISTVEDPVEYAIVGVNQTQVNAKIGMTFASGLRALLRQDPNIIMVGEIRDLETADMAVQAALTGHLVFSTLHTNSAATCLPRLIDMNVETFLIASTVRLIIAQRLLRRVCPRCSVDYQPAGEDLEQIKKMFSISSNEDIELYNQLRDIAISDQITGKSANVAKETPKPEESTAGNNQNYQPEADNLFQEQDNFENPQQNQSYQLNLKRAGDDQSCEVCGGKGYKGRIGIYEALENNHSIQKLIQSNGTSDVIEDQAIKNGMITMKQDGFVKALCGMTTIDEILRVTREED